MENQLVLVTVRCPVHGKTVVVPHEGWGRWLRATVACPSCLKKSKEEARKLHPDGWDL